MPASGLAFSGLGDRLPAFWANLAGHQRRIEETLFDDEAETFNPVRAQIITEVNSLMMICAEFKAATACRDGTVGELRL